MSVYGSTRIYADEHARARLKSGGKKRRLTVSQDRSVIGDGGLAPVCRVLLFGAEVLRRMSRDAVSCGDATHPMRERAERARVHFSAMDILDARGLCAGRVPCASLSEVMLSRSVRNATRIAHVKSSTKNDVYPRDPRRRDTGHRARPRAESNRIPCAPPIAPP